jgi:hypothetical protein
MTDLQPHRHPRPTAPLTAGARFIRGFTRIGSIVAILLALIGVVTSVFIAVDRYNSTETSYQSAKCLAGLITPIARSARSPLLRPDQRRHSSRATDLPCSAGVS